MPRKKNTNQNPTIKPDRIRTNIVELRESITSTEDENGKVLVTVETVDALLRYVEELLTAIEQQETDQEKLTRTVQTLDKKNAALTEEANKANAALKERENSLQAVDQRIGELTTIMRQVAQVDVFDNLVAANEEQSLVLNSLQQDFRILLRVVSGLRHMVRYLLSSPDTQLYHKVIYDALMALPDWEAMEQSQKLLMRYLKNHSST